MVMGCIAGSLAASLASTLHLYSPDYQCFQNRPLFVAVKKKKSPLVENPWFNTWLDALKEGASRKLRGFKSTEVEQPVV